MYWCFGLFTLFVFCVLTRSYLKILRSKSRSPDELHRVAAVVLEVPEENRPPQTWQVKLATAVLPWWANPQIGKLQIDANWDLRCQNVAIREVKHFSCSKRLICQNLLQASPTCKPIDCTPPCTHWKVFHLENFSHLFTSLLKPDLTNVGLEAKSRPSSLSDLALGNWTNYDLIQLMQSMFIHTISTDGIHCHTVSFDEEMSRYLSAHNQEG